MTVCKNSNFLGMHFSHCTHLGAVFLTITAAVMLIGGIVAYYRNR
jgi:hypothetical protein